MAKPPAKKTTSTKNGATPKGGKESVQAAPKLADKTRSYMSQEDIPAYDLEEALLVAKALLQEYGGHASTPLDVAAAMDLTPTSGKFRMLCGASIAYGLTVGGYNAAQIAPTDLARQIIEPQDESADLAGKREAVMKPRIIREFLSKYSGSPLPREDIGLNVLKGMNVPADRTKQVWDMVLSDVAPVSVRFAVRAPPVLKSVSPDASARTRSVSGARASCGVDGHCSRSAMLRSSRRHLRSIRTASRSGTHHAAAH